MFPMIRIAMVGSTCIVLTACGGAGTGNPQTPTGFVDRVDASRAMQARLDARSATVRSAMPNAGRATFDGYATLAIDPTSGPDIDLIGDAVLAADFGGGTLTGQVRNLESASRPIAGVINIGTGISIIGDDVDDNLTNRANDWLATYRGALTIGGDRYEPEGMLTGQFIGTRTNPANGQSVVRGIVGRDDDGYAVVNGRVEEVPAVLSVVAENG
ncbi:hypothetical protein K3729_13155 [Rhodobacteraceae bacterium S2214]|nr:hypothetical protein K3729_13155 [Rhodobacteraceae bacterium S2214]